MDLVVSVYSFLINFYQNRLILKKNLNSIPELELMVNALKSRVNQMIINILICSGQSLGEDVLLSIQS